jgi:predicted amidophosphoribosyltransferase
MDYRYHYIMDYLPTRYNATREDWANRRAVWNFKDGKYSSNIMEEMVSTINRIVTGSKTDWIICFIPASTSSKTEARYSSLADELYERTGVQTSLESIKKTTDTESGHIAGKSSDPTSSFFFNQGLFRGKKIILIDDVITRGRTFTQTTNKLLANGALSVIGLFVAKTINPDWNNMVA